MKAVLLAGGLGTRFAEETDVRPKPMIEIGGKPILWHIMKIYSANGINEFVVCLGYRGYVIKEYFINYFLHMSDVTIDLCKNDLTVHQAKAEPWSITLVDTGEETMIGGRIKQVLPYVNADPAFCVTYGDGVGDVNIRETIEFHNREHRLGTVTATQPPGRYGERHTAQPRALGTFTVRRGNVSQLNPDVAEAVRRGRFGLARTFCDL